MLKKYLECEFNFKNKNKNKNKIKEPLLHVYIVTQMSKHFIEAPINSNSQDLQKGLKQNRILRLHKLIFLTKP